MFVCLMCVCVRTCGHSDAESPRVCGSGLIPNDMIRSPSLSLSFCLHPPLHCLTSVFPSLSSSFTAIHLFHFLLFPPSLSPSHPPSVPNACGDALSVVLKPVGRLSARSQEPSLTAPPPLPCCSPLSPPPSLPPCRRRSTGDCNVSPELYFFYYL